MSNPTLESQKIFDAYFQAAVTGLAAAQTFGGGLLSAQGIADKGLAIASECMKIRLEVIRASQEQS